MAFFRYTILARSYDFGVVLFCLLEAHKSHLCLGYSISYAYTNGTSKIIISPYFPLAKLSLYTVRCFDTRIPQYCTWMLQFVGCFISCLDTWMLHFSLGCSRNRLKTSLSFPSGVPNTEKLMKARPRGRGVWNR